MKLLILHNLASMNKILTLLLAICALSCSGNKTTIYEFTAETNSGEELHFSQYKGMVLLIVNTASRCGFTPQYDGLEALYQKYASKGFVVIGFPCDQFGHQEPGTNEEIEEFCRLNHGVTFPLMAKSDVNGENANEVFKGRIVARFEPVVTPEQIAPEIEALL